MKRQQLAHLLRSACQIAHDKDVLVLGSQAILGTYDDDELTPAVRMSMEADIAFLNDPDRRKADDVEGAIGEMSAFHETNQVCAEGTHIDTAELPAGWRDRLVSWNVSPANPPTPGSSSRTISSSASSPPDAQRTSCSRQPCSTHDWSGSTPSPSVRDCCPAAA